MSKIILPFFKGKVIAVAGLGLTGQSAIRSLIRSEAKKIIIWDEDPEVLSKQTTSDKVVVRDLTLLASCADLDGLIVTPCIKPDNPIIKNANRSLVEIFSDLDLVYKACPEAKFIGVTGTNGKSTTTYLIYQMLKFNSINCYFGGNIGYPALDLPKLSANEYYVLEVSSYQLHYSKSIKFDVAILLNCIESHLDYHKTFDQYLKAKTSIFRAQTKDDVKIIGIDDKSCLALATAYKSSGFDVGLISSNTCFFQVIGWQNNLMIDASSYPEQIVLTSDLIPQFVGSKARQNIAAVYCLGLKLNIDPSLILQSIIQAKGLKFRAEVVTKHNNIQIVNDSKATNINSCLNVIQSFNNIHLMLGGQSQDEDFSQLIPFLNKVECLYIFGQAKDEIASVLGEAKPYYLFDSLKLALTYINNNLIVDNKKNIVLLFSPACSSFDEFTNFVERGEYFEKEVLSTVEKEKKKLANYYDK